MANAREIAVSALNEILDEGAYNNIVLKRTLNKYNNINHMERGLITELVNGTLRNMILIDYVIASYTKTPPKKAFINNLLRISVYQLIFMDNIPDSAACNEAVKIAKGRGFKDLSSYINAVLRNIARNKEKLSLPKKDENIISYLSVIYSHPQWLIEYWLGFLEEEQVETICKANNLSPAVSICINTAKITAAELESRLIKEGITVMPSDHRAAFKIKGAGAISNLESFKAGLYHVMDSGGMKAVDLIKPQPKDSVLDLCAAPGGKSFYACTLMKNEGKILSLDIHEHKLSLIAEGAKRQGFSIIDVGKNDASVYNAELEDKFDKVILDAPCSGLGVLSKKPDARYKKTMADIEELVKIQRSMLLASHKYPKIGGRLLYCTCTVSIKENEENTAWFLQNFPYQLECDYKGQNELSEQGDRFYAVSFIRNDFSQ